MGVLDAFKKIQEDLKAKKEIAVDYLEELKKDEHGKHAMIIGEVTIENPGKVIMKSSIGGKRIVNFLPGEQLPRIC